MKEQCVYLCTTNDRSGNPRRAYVFTSADRLKGIYRSAYREGYAGFSGVADQVTEDQRDVMWSAMHINVTPKEWKRVTGFTR